MRKAEVVMRARFVVRSRLSFACVPFCIVALAAVPLVSGCAAKSNVAPGAVTPQSTNADDAPIKEGREWARKFYEHDTQAIWNQMTPEMQSFMKSKKALDDFRDMVEGQAGKETKMLEERVEPRPTGTTYVRTSSFARSSMRLALRIGFDSAGKIDLFGIKPAEERKEAPTAYLQYVTRTPLRLPFDGTWTVHWGGRTIVQNPHAAMPDQRFAYDFAIEKDGKAYRTSGRENDDYFAFGQSVLAPAAGTVVEVVDGIDDNKPGDMNPAAPAGNHVVIDHGQKEFSFLAHLKKGSTRVKKGDQVEAGAPIGLCGNSGNSAGPHLHYHLQNTPVFAKGDGLPAQFRNYTSSGRFVESGEPGREEVIVNGRE
jgi:murein DD-endopeptidase MepM/ murein hydrolase activator NlpD